MPSLSPTSLKPEIITAIYENGVLRPFSPLPLQEHQTVTNCLPCCKLPDRTTPEIRSLSRSRLVRFAIAPHHP
ncbi:MAG: antitoxin family protein [Cyanobacteriota bacterium]